MRFSISPLGASQDSVGAVCLLYQNKLLALGPLVGTGGVRSGFFSQLSSGVFRVADHRADVSSCSLSSFALQLADAGVRCVPLVSFSSSAASLQDWLISVSEKGEDNFS